MGKSVARLFTQFQPKSYDVRFNLDEDKMVFTGSVTITGKKVGRPSQRVTFHQKGLKITGAEVIRHDKKGDQTLDVERINNQDSFNEVRLHTSEMAYPGEYTVRMSFEGTIKNAMTGIYPSYFKDGDEEKMLIATQFESHHAREAFPCIDEPEAKATFDLSLVTRLGITVLGNTPAKEQKEFASKDGGLTAHDTTAGETIPMYLLTSFETTPRMSSYLLAFVCGELQSKGAETNRGTQVNIWATVAQPADSLDFAVDVAKRSIEFFEEYFDTPYPLAKADHVALPDFSSGAMENWGLITYRERVLLAYPGETAQDLKEQIATVIAHETSHQWFGNLVTMRWWDDLWLNESFANMMEYQAVDAMFPDWHIWNYFVAAEGLSALRRDAIAGVQAVRTEVHHPDEISSLFDPSIVYAKGGRLLYMLKSYIGEDAFRTGLKRYFEIHAYGNTEGADLWSCLSDASGKDIAAFMNPWLTRSGFPVVHVTQHESKVTLKQEHFLDDPAKADPDRVWPVPLFTSAEGQPDELTGKELTLTAPNSDVVRVNTGGRGHYIVDYTTPEQKQALRDLVASRTIAEADRLMLLNGNSMLARAGFQHYGEVLQLLKAYKQEASEPVWDIISLILGESRRFIDQDDSLDDQIKSFVGTLITTQLERLGWEAREGESAADTKLRALIIALGSYAERSEVVDKALVMFKDYKDTGGALPSDLRPILLGIPIKRGDDAAFEFLLKQHDSTQNSDLKGDLSDALTATRSSEKATILLERIKDSKLVKPQDADRWLVYLLRNRYVRETAWDWMVSNWQWFEDTFRNDKSYDYLPRYAAGVVNTRAYQQKYKDLFESKVDQLILKRNIEIGLEEIENRLTWLERDLTSVQRFFQA